MVSHHDDNDDYYDHDDDNDYNHDHYDNEKIDDYILGADHDDHHDHHLGAPLVPVGRRAGVGVQRNADPSARGGEPLPLEILRGP